MNRETAWVWGRAGGLLVRFGFCFFVLASMGMFPFSAFGQSRSNQPGQPGADGGRATVSEVQSREDRAYDAWSRSVVVVGARVGEAFGSLAKAVQEFNAIRGKDLTGSQRVNFLTEISEVAEKSRKTARELGRAIERQFPDPNFHSPEYRDSVKVTKDFYLSVFGIPPAGKEDISGDKEPDSIREPIPFESTETFPSIIDRHEIRLLSLLRSGERKSWPLHPIRLIRTALEFENSALLTGHRVVKARKQKASDDEIVSLQIREQVDRGVALGLRALSLLSDGDGEVNRRVEKRILQGQDAVGEAVIMAQGTLEKAIRDAAAEETLYPVAEVRKRAPAVERRLTERLRWLGRYSVRAERDIADQATQFLNAIAEFERANYAELLVDMLDDLRRISRRRHEISIRRARLEALLEHVREQRRLARFPLSADGRTRVLP